MAWTWRRSRSTRRIFLPRFSARSGLTLTPPTIYRNCPRSTASKTRPSRFARCWREPMKTEKVKEISLPSAVLALDAAPDGKMLFAACQDGGVFVVDADSGQRELIGRHESYASGVALLPDGKMLLSAGYDGVLQWHELADRKTVRKVKA